MRINMGAHAYSSTGEKGNPVERVIVEPDTWTASYLVVAKGGGLKSDKLIPIDMVDRWTENSVTLRLSLDDLKRMPDYLPTQYSTPRQLLPRPKRPSGKNLPSTELLTQEGVPFGPGILPHESRPKDRPISEPREPESGPIQLRDGAKVQATDGPFGTLDQILLDVYTNRISSLIVKRGNQRFDIPVEWVAYIDPDEIRLAATQKQAENLVGPPAGYYLPESPDDSERSGRGGAS